MSNVITKSLEWGSRKLTIETGKVARQADGSVIVKYGDTVVLCTAVIGKTVTQPKDYVPLTVNYIEKLFSVGKIPGGYFKREGKSSEKEILTSRLIDRSLRPTFPEGFCNDVQIICTLLSHDRDCDPDVIALIGASAALSIAGAPVTNIIAASRVGYIDGEFVLNPSYQACQAGSLDLVVACDRENVFMVESEAKELTDLQMLEAIKIAHNSCVKIIGIIESIVAECGKEKFPLRKNYTKELFDSVQSFVVDRVTDIYHIQEKCSRNEALVAIRSEVVERFASESISELSLRSVLKKIEEVIVKKMIIDEKKRIDGRKCNEIRKISSEIDILPKTCVHGSSLFTRGETQAIVAITLGSGDDEQSIEVMESLSKKEPFMLHYNFPPYSVGEIEMLRGPGRREIGHGKLAYKALKGLLPKRDAFPYTIRIVSEITESNGSSSMATVCGSSLALMATGVPIQKAVAGIAMGLVKHGDSYSILSDIIGDEDHFGDMDFKVAGTKDGITALQMDIKTNGITFDIMRDALKQAKDGYLNIMDHMNSTISESLSLNEHAPQIIEVNIPVPKIADLIGKGGAMIKSICEKTACKIDIGDTGLVKVYAVSTEAGAMAVEMINDAVLDLSIGTIYDGEIDRIMAFGAIVLLPGKKQGMVHISEINGERIDDINSVLSVGQMVKVVVIGFDEKKRVKLSIKRVGEPISESSDSEDRRRFPRERDSFGGSKRAGGGRFDRGNGSGRSGGRYNNNDYPNSSPRGENEEHYGNSITSIDNDSFFANLGMNHNVRQDNRSGGERRRGTGRRYNNDQRVIDSGNDRE